jgi:tRNA modification GTPase
MSAPTICALASSAGKSGVGIVRVSGALASIIAKKMLGFTPEARYAHYGVFRNQAGEGIDKGIALFFPAPHSFTGEDVLELQGHGGTIVMQEILTNVLSLGAEPAEPGEFSKRAFLNGKMDLVQVEAVADMIDATSKQASQSALKSLSGEFSKKINKLTQSIIQLRVFVEATIDFSDEEIDFLQNEQVKQKTQTLKTQIQIILKSAQQGAILRNGLSVAIAGKPNAGKSSLLNALTQNDSAIVTDIAGTTRDILKETIHIKGVPLNIIDTAGLHESVDIVEREGIKRAKNAIQQADVVLLVFDAREAPDFTLLPKNTQAQVLLIKNKVDLVKSPIEKNTFSGKVQLNICAKDALGLDLLRDELSNISGLSDTQEGVLLARERHLIALKSALGSVVDALLQLENGAVELMAEDLKAAAGFMGSITGEFSSDDLLGEIFSSFCIGK